MSTCTQQRQDIDMFSGDTLRVIVEVRDQSGALMDVSAAQTITWRAAPTPGGTQVISKSTSTANLTKTSGAGFFFDLLPADTAALDGRYYHEAQVVTSTGAVYTVMSGALRVRPDLIV
jgi:hypothetical protein